MKKRTKSAIAGVVFGTAVTIGSMPLWIGGSGGAAPLPPRARIINEMQLIPHGDGTCNPGLAHLGCRVIKEDR